MLGAGHNSSSSLVGVERRDMDLEKILFWEALVNHCRFVTVWPSCLIFLGSSFTFALTVAGYDSIGYETMYVDSRRKKGKNPIVRLVH